MSTEIQSRYFDDYDYEDEFEIEVPDRKIKMMKTVADIVAFIESQMS